MISEECSLSMFSILEDSNGVQTVHSEVALELPIHWLVTTQGNKTSPHPLGVQCESMIVLEGSVFHVKGVAQLHLGDLMGNSRQNVHSITAFVQFIQLTEDEQVGSVCEAAVLGWSPSLGPGQDACFARALRFALPETDTMPGSELPHLSNQQFPGLTEVLLFLPQGQYSLLLSSQLLDQVFIAVKHITPKWLNGLKQQ